MKKTLKQDSRFRSAKNWIKTYSGNNIVKAYSKKFSVDKLCAIKELRMIGVEISEEYVRQLISSIKTLQQQKLSFKKNREYELKTLLEFENDENFAMILGYTSGGVPFGLTHEEMEEINESEIE